MRKGFTLIELLIVIAIIALLATLAIVSLTTAQQKARDTKRLADIKQLQNAIELFFSEDASGEYPDPANWTALGGASGLAPYITTMPIDPNNTTTDYYVYAVNDDGDQYVVGARLEDDGHDALAGDDDLNYTSAPLPDASWAGITPIASTGGNVATATIGRTAALDGAPDSVNCDDAANAGDYCLSE